MLSAKLKDQPVLSLRTGGQIATVQGPLINPDNLAILGFYCQDTFGKSELILLNQDIREHIQRGFVVNDHEVLAEQEDLVRFQKILDIHYDPLGKLIVTERGRTLGKVSDYAVDNQSLFIKKIYGTPRLLKSLTGSSLSIDRNQVVEVTDKKIVVKEAEVKEPARELSPAPTPATS